MQKKTTITLFNTDDFTGGAAIACRRLLKALQQNATVTAAMLVQSARSKQQGVVALDTTWFQRKMSFVRFVLERLWFWPYEQSKAVRFQFNLGRFGRNITHNQAVINSDIVHLHWVNFGFLSIDSLKKLFKTNKPIVWTLHDMWAFTGGCHHSGTCNNYQNTCGNCTQFLKKSSDNDLSNQIWQHKKEAFEGANLTIVTCSDWLGQRAKHSSLFKNTRVETIPNPIDIELFKPVAKSEARTKLGLDPSKNYILFAAMRVSAVGKGFAYFKEALDILKQQNLDNTELLIFGQSAGLESENLPFKINALGYLDSPDKIALVYAAASLFAIPSLEENLPNTIMESLACGTPVVGFEVGGIPEMIDHQQNGYLATYKSSESLATGIQYVLQNTDYQQLCTNARQKIIENYSESVVAQRYVKLYESLIH
jgi:glycosyltransferase involved in cell wall biosynthesis